MGNPNSVNQKYMKLGFNIALLTHWDRVTLTCVSKLSISGSQNGLAPGLWQAIIWTNAGILLIRTLGTNFSDVLSKIYTFSFKKMHFKMLFAKWRLFRLGLNESFSQLYQLWRQRHTKTFICSLRIPIAISYTVRCCYNAVNFLTNIRKSHPIARKVRTVYGVCFVDPASDWYSASVPVIIYAISYNIGPPYNGTWLYFEHQKEWMIVPRVDFSGTDMQGTGHNVRHSF